MFIFTNKKCKYLAVCVATVYSLLYSLNEIIFKVAV